MTKKEDAKYWLYLRTHGIFLGDKKRGMPYLTASDKTKGHYFWSKDDFKWEFAELYYEISKGRESTESLMQ